MTKKEKLLARLLVKPKDFTYDELTTLLKSFGYAAFKKSKTGGSRRTFINNKTMHIIKLHKPHPENTLKRYQIDEIIDD